MINIFTSRIYFLPGPGTKWLPTTGNAETAGNPTSTGIEDVTSAKPVNRKMTISMMKSSQKATTVKMVTQVLRRTMNGQNTTIKGPEQVGGVAWRVEEAVRQKETVVGLEIVDRVEIKINRRTQDIGDKAAVQEEMVPVTTPENRGEEPDENRHHHRETMTATITARPLLNHHVVETIDRGTTTTTKYG